MSVHRCDAIVVCCMDFRFQKYIRKWTEKNLKHKSFDLVGYAGATKSLGIVLKQIELSIKLHHTKQIILLHHEECGAYGAESNPKRHAKDLRKARKKILEKHPKVKVDLYYIRLNGDFEKVE
ncbi:MAG: hypothetical protein PVJ09_02545 [Candidatus Woesebacteria bacterium]